jgi:hypothetical protein
MQMEKFDYKSIILEEMVAYIKKNAPQDKDWFLNEAYVYKTTKDGRKKVYNHLKAKRAFCERYMPEIIPVAKAKAPKASEILENW